MLFMKLSSLIPEINVTDADSDYKKAAHVGQYRVSPLALYRPDGKYLPFSAVTGILHDKTGLHVTGCCLGSVMVDRLVCNTAAGKFQFMFDTKKELERFKEVTGLEFIEKE